MQAAALYRSSIGKKAVMAVTGLIWIGYVVVHMYGNLKVFLGAEYFNEYAHGLRYIGAPVFGHLHLLTIARIVLVASIVLHVWSALALTKQARQARPSSYASRRVIQANYAAMTMRYGGVVLVLFILFHLAQLTWGVPGTLSEFKAGDPYANVMLAFQSLPVVLIYIAGLVALGFHLYHGAWSMFQTLGFMSRQVDSTVRALAWALAIVVPVGFALVPLAVQFGLIG
jgi:succinate dehydrogenase / fumarate reductase, cytochrome b subunit